MFPCANVKSQFHRGMWKWRKVAIHCSLLLAAPLRKVGRSLPAQTDQSDPYQMRQNEGESGVDRHRSSRAVRDFVIDSCGETRIQPDARHRDRSSMAAHGAQCPADRANPRTVRCSTCVPREGCSCFHRRRFEFNAQRRKWCAARASKNSKHTCAHSRPHIAEIVDSKTQCKYRPVRHICGTWRELYANPASTCVRWQWPRRGFR